MTSLTPSFTRLSTASSKRSILLTLFVLSLSALIAHSVRAWKVTLPAGSRAETVVVDAAGDIIAAGRAYYGGEVIKISGTTGQLIWQFNASHNQTEKGAIAIALDSHGDVFVLFAAQRGVTKISGVTGQLIWTGIIGGSIAGCQNFYNAIAVDRDDNVVAAGTAGCLFSVGKLDGVTGDERWHYECDGLAYAVAVDPFGDVSAAGIMNLNFGTVKLRGNDGAQLWRNEINGTGSTTNVYGDEQANAVVMKPDGGVVVAGSTSIGNSRDFTVAKYATNGTVEWIRRLDGDWCETNDHGERVCQANDVANAVALGKDGSIFAAGSMQDDGTSFIRGANQHFHVVKFSSDGNVLWSKPAEEPGFEAEYVDGHAFALSVNAFGNVVAAGVHGGRFTLVKFWGRTGGRAWRRPIDSGQAVKVVMDAASDVVAAGETIGSDGFSNFTVIKVRRVDGLDYDADFPSTPPDTVVELAPLVFLYPDEKYWPGDPLTFISNSSLNWFHEGGCPPDPVAPLHFIQADRLGVASIAQYTAKPDNYTINGASCVPLPGIELKTENYTRPWDGRNRNVDNPFWNDLYYEKEGFYLDQDDDENVRQGIKGIPGNSNYPGAPVFYAYVPGRYVTYWFFYPYNKFETTSAAPDQAHEGDWERISIQLDGDVPIRIFYYNHGGGDIFDWSDVFQVDNHVLVFSAKGSHASYPIASGPLAGFDTDAPGFLGKDHTDYGPKWRTWESLLDVTKQAWYGYGGAWGRVSTIPEITIPLVGSISGETFTGPLGPSSFKTSFDKWFPRISGRVTGPNNTGLPGVKIKAFDEHGDMAEEATTCAGNDPACGAVGYYSLKNLVFGKSYTLVPSKPGYPFTPAVRVFTDLREPKTANFAVADTIPPRLILPSDIAVNANIPQGATASFTVGATDNVTQNPRIACTSQSGSLFPIGTTTVACTATDEAGNSANGTFKIVVKGSAEQITDLIILVRGFNLPNGIENSLSVKLQHALSELKAGHRGVACNQLMAFTNEVQAQYGKKIGIAQANKMLTAAARIRTVMGC